MTGKSQAQSEAAVSRVRDESGKFIEGNPGGPGPTPNRDAYLKTTMRKCTLERWDNIVDKAIEQAERGNEKARDWLTKFIIPNVPRSTSSPLVAFNLNRPIPTKDEIIAAIKDQILGTIAQEKETGNALEPIHVHPELDRDNHHQDSEANCDPPSMAADQMACLPSKENQPEVLTPPQQTY